MMGTHATSQKHGKKGGNKKTTNNNSCAGCAAHFSIEKCRPVS